MTDYNSKDFNKKNYYFYKLKIKCNIPKWLEDTWPYRVKSLR